MQKIKVNNWECRRDIEPKGYPVAKCEDYFNKAKWTYHTNQQNFHLSTKKFDKIFRRDIMYVWNGAGNTITCIRPNWRNWPHGWCELPKSTPGDLKWGICSPSCSINLMKVI